MDADGRLDEADFKRTLILLKEAGFNLTHPPSEDSDHADFAWFNLLHTIAQSRHRDTLNALVVALEVGCDPTVRNNRDALPSDLVDDPAVRARWLAIEQSHLARLSAMAAVESIDGLVPSHIGENSISNPKTPRKPQCR